MMGTTVLTPRRDDLAYYRELYDGMTVLADWKNRIASAADTIGKYRRYYDEAARHCGPVPAVFLGLLHFRERGCNFRYQLLNGEAWNEQTRLVPAGHGPWKSWTDATEYGMRHWKMTEIDDWGIPRVLKEAEKWNGLGYRNHGVHSPYLWTASNHGLSVGKYVADGHYDPDALDQQVGCAPLLLQLLTAKVWSL